MAKRRLKRRWHRLTIMVLIALLVVYVGSYLVLSRRAFAEADRWDIDGFYFLPPEDTNEWRFWNYTLVRVYYPLIVIDNGIGTGRPIGAEPTWRLE
jgi:hypothetical protein